MTRKAFAVLYLLFALLPIAAKSQDSKFLVSGSIGFSVTDSYHISGFDTHGKSSLLVTNGSITFGYFVSEQFMIGASISHQYSSSKYSSTYYSNSSNSSNTVSPLFRRYFNSNLFTQVQVNLGAITINYAPIPDSEYETINKTHKTIYGLGAGIGYSLELSESISIEPKVLYQINRHNSSLSSMPDEIKLIVISEIGLVFRF
ncbi:autotransporter domain-containing protein [Perlabentimonas gracilis]|uniref:autotransporter domain-containing protein n=1 Tax=Perlabentimonas gracilis TaxID=2715279 RepID=UPI0014091735|nr:autotransporter domain-containing protein [Perlabentimonas gracilis]NHB67445.1 autotransporter domain-containing protein [Perlabentimonas gracilis]